MMEDVLKSIIIDAVDKVYIGELRNKYTGYLGITARDLQKSSRSWNHANSCDRSVSGNPKN